MSGQTKKYDQHLSLLRRELGLKEEEVTLKKLCVKYGCGQALESAERLLQDFVQKYSATLSRSERQLFKVDDNELVAAIFKECCAAMRVRDNSRIWQYWTCI